MCQSPAPASWVTGSTLPSGRAGDQVSAVVSVIGVSHHSAAFALLDRIALSGDSALKLLHDVRQAGAQEAMVVATCNRLEIYTVAEHDSTATLTELLARHTAVPEAQLVPHVFAYRATRAVEHLFAVVCGLDSLAVGEGQILGQVRAAFRSAQSAGAVGAVLNQVVQQALRLGKRARTELDLDDVNGSLVAAGLRLAGPVAGKNVLLIGAGSMGALTGAAVLRAGVGTITVASRTQQRAEHLAAKVGGHAVAMTDLPAALAQVDLVVTCTSAPHHLITADMLNLASGHRLTIVDLAVPGDVDPAVGRLARVELITLRTLQQAGATQTSEALVEAVRTMVADELNQLGQRQLQDTQVVPTLVALRQQMDALVTTELDRLNGRVPDLDPRTRAAVAQALRRMAAKVLHQPTVRLQQLGSSAEGAWAAALVCELFAISPPGMPVPSVQAVPSAAPVLAAAAGHLTPTAGRT